MHGQPANPPQNVEPGTTETPRMSAAFGDPSREPVSVIEPGAGNVVVAGRPPNPLDTFLAGCLDRKLPVAAAFHEASAHGTLLFYGAPE